MEKEKSQKIDAVSAVVAVILMVSITIAIAATVYVYVSGMISNREAPEPWYEWENHTGLLRGYWDDPNTGDPIYIGDEVIHNVVITNDDLKYLSKFLGKNTTIMFWNITRNYGWSYDIGEMHYIGAYLEDI